EAYQLHYLVADAIDLIFEQGNPAGIKEVFKTLGLCENTVRLPLVNVNEDLANRIRQMVKKVLN
ncbi:MAG TPA: dihydrodipicolinate synthase family protein, partial [Flavobacterium sp.]|nr:dihydrodipicolinate synthase family protein [Flavobacterium sp.]